MFLEDAGFDWKVLGPDVADIDYVAWQCDQDAYACSGQKCSAQSIMFMHENWAAAGAQRSHCGSTRWLVSVFLWGSRLRVGAELRACSRAECQRQLCAVVRGRASGATSCGWKVNPSPIPCAGLEAKLKALAAKRQLADLSVGPVLTWTTKRMLEHVEKVLAIPGSLQNPPLLDRIVAYLNRLPQNSAFSWPLCW